MSLKTTPMFANPFWEDNFPDPFVLKVRGRYYAYATENEHSPEKDAGVFPILASDDFVHWHAVGKAMRSFGPPYHSYWAPEVTEYNGRFYLYYAVHRVEEFLGAIRVAVAERPEGPFVDSGHDLTSELVPWAIDPHIYRDWDGQWYLFMTIEYLKEPSGFVGSGNAVVRLLDPFTVAGPLTRVTAPAHSWQLFEAKRPEKGSIDWYTVEGPAVIRHRNTYYEMYSGGCYLRENYAVSYATAPTPMGSDGMQDSTWKDWPGNQQQEVLLGVRKNHVLGPGHNSLVLGPNNADLYMAYHAWPPEMSARRPFLDRLFWHGEELWTPGPSYEPQPVPAQPALRELFQGPVMDVSWQQLSGDWYLAPGEVIQNDPSSEISLLHQQMPLGECWLLEVHMRLLEGDGFYGILLRSESDMMIALASTLSHRLAIWASTSQEEPLHVLPLKPDFDPQVWHRLLLRCSGSLLNVEMDGLPLLDLPISQTANTFALCTESCSVAFTGVTLTYHFRDEFLNEEYTPAFLGWRLPANLPGDIADWKVQDGALVQSSVVAGTHMLVKGIAQCQYEFGGTMQLRRRVTCEQPAFGLLLQNEQESLEICLGPSEEGWKILIKDTNGVSSLRKEHVLSDNFDPEQWHTLRLLVNDRQLNLYLDGPQILTLELSEGRYICGLLTRNASCAFIGIWQTSFVL